MLKADPATIDLDHERARAAWLLAVDVCESAVEGAAFSRIYNTPGKVGRGSDARTALARKFACYLTATVGNCSQTAVARAAKLHRVTVMAHLNEVEDMRDQAQIDTLLDDLRERMIRGACGVVMASLGGAA